MKQALKLDIPARVRQPFTNNTNTTDSLLQIGPILTYLLFKSEWLNFGDIKYFQKNLKNLSVVISLKFWGKDFLKIYIQTFVPNMHEDLWDDKIEIGSQLIWKELISLFLFLKWLSRNILEAGISNFATVWAIQSYQDFLEPITFDYNYTSNNFVNNNTTFDIKLELLSRQSCTRADRVVHKYLGLAGTAYYMFKFKSGDVSF